MTEAELDEFVDDMYELDGRVMDFGGLAYFMTNRREQMNELYHQRGELVWVGFGFNDGDDSFTVNIDIR